ncbi:phosphoadenosine phosphosulfate reductase family protein [Agrobacterium salinitolerans]|nr:phosphoadenosine phosphosulfate reductase family protein [Agrobacterium salinitolerans]
MFIDAPEVSAETPDLKSYDRILVAFSGGKDSLAVLLHLLESGVSPSSIELHHHDVDGDGPVFMDWAVTRSYCQAVAEHFGIPIYFSCRLGGFEREMNRDDEATAPVKFEVPTENGTVVMYAGGNGEPNTRRKFPQLAASLSVRWCSASLKIDVMAAVIRNQERFIGRRTLVVTGERSEESPARARYLTMENHRTDLRNSAKKPRHVDHWRPIHGWSESKVWDIIRRFGIVPHVAYQLGWSRLSCMACIFGSPNQWATILHVFRERFERIEAKEIEFGVTIRRSDTIRQAASKGQPYPAALDNPALVVLANSHEWNVPIAVSPEEWVLPAGAFGENAGPI